VRKRKTQSFAMGKRNFKNKTADLFLRRETICALDPSVFQFFTQDDLLTTKKACRKFFNGF
jgi:hypothetical protein